MSLSYSQISKFKQCPLSYKLHYVDGLPEPESAAGLIGTVVHEALEAYYTPERPLLAACVWTHAEGRLDMKSREAAMVLATAIWELEDPMEVRVHACELDLTEEIDGLQIRGILDRVDEDGTIIDYKTGKSPREAHLADRMDQGLLYAMLYEAYSGFLPPAVKFYYLAEGKVLTFIPTRAQVDGLKMRVKAVAEAIQRGRDSGCWDPRTGPLCNWCPYQALCPEFGGEPL